MSKVGTTGKYVIVRAAYMKGHNPESMDNNLEREINIAQQRGFSPIGPITVHSGMLYQLMGLDHVPSSGGGGRKSRARKGYKKYMKKTRRRKV
jgi:hypothetical protein